MVRKCAIALRIKKEGQRGETRAIHKRTDLVKDSEDLMRMEMTDNVLELRVESQGTWMLDGNHLLSCLPSAATENQPYTSACYVLEKRR